MGTSYGTGIVTSSLVFYADAGNTKSYPGSGTTFHTYTNKALTAAEVFQNFNALRTRYGV